ncbi:MAG: hypothetical protein ACJA08_000286 [Cyclobacteriaceae bacterium]
MAGYAVKSKILTKPDLDLTQKSSYTTQLILARQFSQKFSAQLMSTLVLRNLVPSDEKNDIISLGMAGQYQFLKNWSLSAEYYLTPKSSLPDGTGVSGEYFQSLAFGIQIDTKGHVFQLHVGNSAGMTERIFITETGGDWIAGDIFFGFNITRDFKVKGRKIR